MKYFKGGTMKNIIFILLFSTTLFAQTSAITLYEESQKALSSGNLELAGEKAVSYTHLTLPTNREV